MKNDIEKAIKGYRVAIRGLQRQLKKPVVNKEQEIYILPYLSEDGDEIEGYTCLGFDHALKTTKAVSNWLNNADILKLSKRGTMAAYDQYRRIMSAGFRYHQSTGGICPADLTPKLIGLEGKKVRVTYEDGTKETFRVGRSTGWMPCHLAIESDRDDGGPAVLSGIEHVEVLGC